MLSNASRRRTLSSLAAVAMLALIPLVVADAKPPQSKSTSSYGDASQALLRGALSGSLVSDAELFGVQPGTSPWVLDRGSVRLDGDGRLRLRVRGLVIPDAPASGTNPVPSLTASVFCGGMLVATSATVPFSPRGDARIDQDIGRLPSPCATPAVLVHPNAVTARYIAFNGSRG